MIAKIINTVFYTIFILLIIGLFVVFGSKEAKACDDEEYDKQFRASIDAECKIMVPKVWRECSTWEEIEDASNE